MGLFRETNAAVVRPVHVRIDAVHDPILDRPGAQTGTRVAARGAEQPLALLAGLPAAPPRRPLTHIAGPIELTPAMELPVTRVDQAPCRLLVIATPGPPEARQDAGRYAVTLRCGERTQTLVDQLYPRFEGGFAELLWAGDLDGDARPDLLLRINRKNATDTGLWLSSQGGSELMGLWQLFTAIGC